MFLKTYFLIPSRKRKTKTAHKFKKTFSSLKKPQNNSTNCFVCFISWVFLFFLAFQWTFCGTNVDQSSNFSISSNFPFFSDVKIDYKQNQFGQNSNGIMSKNHFILPFDKFWWKKLPRRPHLFSNFPIFLRNQSKLKSFLCVFATFSFPYFSIQST